MSERKVKVVIDAMGTARIEAVGFNGMGCTDATAPLENALAGGGAKMEREFKPEWSQMDTDAEAQNHMMLTG